MKSEFEKRGIEPVGNAPQEFSAFIRSESERWRQLATRINLKPE
jgi:tripartite-type tricarboxylate transporter receptor subunit TctC